MRVSSLALTLILVSALVISSASLAVSVTSRSAPEAQDHASIPLEAFQGLGGKKGVGFGDWMVNYESPNLTIFSYPAGSEIGREEQPLDVEGVYRCYYPRLVGWDDYLVDMLMTITVTMETSWLASEQVDVTFYYLQPFWNETEYYVQGVRHLISFTDFAKAETTMRIGLSTPQTTTFTGQIYLVTVTFVGIEEAGSATGYYFVSADRRV